MAGRRIKGSNWILPGTRQLGGLTAKLAEQAVFVMVKIGAFRREIGVNGPRASSEELRAKKREVSAIGRILQKSMVPMNDRQYNCSTFWLNSTKMQITQKQRPEVLGS